MGGDVHQRRFVRHHNLLVPAGVAPITGPITKGKGKSNTSGKGHGKKNNTDPLFSSTKLLLSGDGALGSTTFIDESAANRGNRTSIGSGGSPNEAQVATSTKVFGTGSMRFDSAYNDFIGWADHADWTGNSDFTAEFFWYVENNANLQSLISHYNPTGNQRGWVLQYRGADATPNITLYGSSNGSGVSSIVSGNFTPTNQAWYFLSLERAGNVFRIHQGPAGGTATLLAKATNAFTFFDSTAQLRLSGTGGGAECMYGGMDEFRWTAAARRNSDDSFAVPTAPFPRF